MTPWELAHDAAASAGVSLRPLHRIEDAHQVDAVIAATWGGQHLDPEIVRALAVSGNLPWGADADGTLIGFVLGWAGVDDEGLHVHSHMLATIPDRRHAGVGYALKLVQRAQALDQGIDVVRWTYDPMLARNAWFNLGKLGAVVDRFERNFYGEMLDALNRGDRSDRCTVRWELHRSPGPRDVTPLRTLEVPVDHFALRQDDAAAAANWRDEVAGAFEANLADGLVAAAFDRERSAYLFAASGDVR
jgi:predicted GNAT superfamily acetyltransferase